MYAGLYARRPAAQVMAYARALAEIEGLAVEEAWWPAVVRHLSGLLDHMDALAGVPPEPADEEREGGASGAVPDPGRR